jgi:putative nucleotidyltransferase with HDIG domain
MVEERTASLRRAMDGIIRAMGLTVESRDPYTSGHQRRVAMLSAAIAEEMGLSQHQVEGIRLAGMIHDLGKITVPAMLLSKPARLTDIEFALVKAHPQVGYDILKEIEFPWPIAEIIYQHHEKTDGSGYPRGLSGEDILLEARIICVADVVEAMASHRPYRPAIGLDKALEEVETNAGRLYDPKAAKACLTLFREKGFSFQ